MLTTSEMHRCGDAVSMEVAAFAKLLQANHHGAFTCSLSVNVLHVCVYYLRDDESSPESGWRHDNAGAEAPS
jgi:hypothetical protein